LSVVWDTLVAPRSTFAILRERPQWRWALVVTAALGTLGALLQVPAQEHVAAALLAPGAAAASLASAPAGKQQQAAAFALAALRWTWLAQPLLVALAVAVATLVMRLALVLVRSGSDPARLFSLAMNVAVVNFGVGSVALAAIELLRGSADFGTERDLVTAMPSLAWLFPGASAKVATFLAEFNPFQLWSFALLALGLAEVARAPRRAAFATAALITFGGALLSAPFVR
jgi:hypothetical protein